ncbi:hypothetical protein M011DRAFT_523242 [Sporormia fimetaria CBS 119925]|uniref:BHLH domain-containing protein n=1 Tax=Sporormia fimetaria CBS 119925 TaxID=1340428 RepID=A0A6A6VKQ0_9PLEO|nr:hypothetical protein M011DRAFT_523242 [Sporormia fimetaria CBS 119925]
MPPPKGDLNASNNGTGSNDKDTTPRAGEDNGSPSRQAPQRLTEQQIKENHQQSERRRREMIRAGFDRLAVAVGMEGQGRSEVLVLGEAVKQTRERLVRIAALVERRKAKGLSLNDLGFDEEILTLVQDQEFIAEVKRSIESEENEGAQS